MHREAALVWQETHPLSKLQLGRRQWYHSYRTVLHPCPGIAHHETIQQDIIFYRLGKPSYSESSSFQPFSSSRLRFRFIFLHLFPWCQLLSTVKQSAEGHSPEDIPMGLLDKLDQLTDVTIQPLFGGQKESVGKERYLCLWRIFIARGVEGNSLDLDEPWDHKRKTNYYSATNGILSLHCSYGNITKNLACHS